MGSSPADAIAHRVCLRGGRRGGSCAARFHPLLLPTFVIEFLPVAGMLPTWTACVAAIVALRRSDLRTAPSDLPDIDVRPTN